MDLWQSVRSKQVRPEAEKLAEAYAEPNQTKGDTKQVDQGPSPSVEVLSAQLQSLMAAYSKLVNRDVDLSDHTQPGAPRFAAQTGRRRVQDARTEPRRQKVTATSSRLLATTASRAAAISQRSKRLATTRTAPEHPRTAHKIKFGHTNTAQKLNQKQATHSSCDPPQASRKAEHALPSPESDHPQADDLNIARPPRRALNPFPQLSPFLPQNRPLTKTPFPQTSSGQEATPVNYHSRTIKKVERPLLSATIPGTFKSASRIQIPSSKKTALQAAPLHPPTPPTKATFSANQPGNPFKDILAKGISPPLEASPLPPPRRRGAH